MEQHQATGATVVGGQDPSPDELVVLLDDGTRRPVPRALAREAGLASPRQGQRLLVELDEQGVVCGARLAQAPLVVH